ncbi:MAG: nuclear transport factor 2 family protein [Steroidobacteraceae bacterium]
MTSMNTPTRRRTLARATLTLLATLAALCPAVPAGARDGDARRDGDVVRELRDRNAIEALMWRYVRALDALDPDAYAATYTADGRFIAGAMTAAGSDALKKIIADYRQARTDRLARGEPATPPMHHVITNTHIVFADRDHARQDAYWMTVFEGQGEATPPRVAAAGRSVDELVRIDGHWLIRTRDVTPRD